MFFSLVHTGGGEPGKAGEGHRHWGLEASAEGVAGMEDFCEWEEGKEGERKTGQRASEGENVSKGEK